MYYEVTVIIGFLKYNLKLIFLLQSVQASKILTERFSAESKESVTILNQHSRSSRVCTIFILNCGSVALSAYSSDILFLVVLEIISWCFLSLGNASQHSLVVSLWRTHFLFFKYVVFVTLRRCYLLINSRISAVNFPKILKISGLALIYHLLPRSFFFF